MVQCVTGVSFRGRFTVGSRETEVSKEIFEISISSAGVSNLTSYGTCCWLWPAHILTGAVCALEPEEMAQTLMREFTMISFASPETEGPLSADLECCY